MSDWNTGEIYALVLPIVLGAYFLGYFIGWKTGKACEQEAMARQARGSR